jgi:hypothetical protein
MSRRPGQAEVRSSTALLSAVPPADRPGLPEVGVPGQEARRAVLRPIRAPARTGATGQPGQAGGRVGTLAGSVQEEKAGVSAWRPSHPWWRWWRCRSRSPCSAGSYTGCFAPAAAAELPDAQPPRTRRGGAPTRPLVTETGSAALIAVARRALASSCTSAGTGACRTESLTARRAWITKASPGCSWRTWLGSTRAALPWGPGPARPAPSRPVARPAQAS